MIPVVRVPSTPLYVTGYVTQKDDLNYYSHEGDWLNNGTYPFTPCRR
jgi:hypothetical protein